MDSLTELSGYSYCAHPNKLQAFTHIHVHVGLDVSIDSKIRVDIVKIRFLYYSESDLLDIFGIPAKLYLTRKFFCINCSVLLAYLDETVDDGLRLSVTFRSLW